jgi:hypothetical protein
VWCGDQTQSLMHAGNTLPLSSSPSS